jgi:hypothetical protein
LESSRCSCSLCSSQGALRLAKRGGSRRGDVHAAPADPKRSGHGGRSFKTE